MKNEKQKEIRYFSMFTGVGGFELGFQRANAVSATSRNESRGDEENSGSVKQVSMATQQFTCVGFSEIDKYSNQLLKNKFPKIKNYGDATKIDADKLPDFELLVGGFPCQAFSIAGKRKGFEDTRGTLFYDIARIIKVKRPRNILLENVKGLLSHDRGRTFGTIISTLSELGYVVQWMVLNSKFFGVPQNRERVFIIGSLRGEPIPEILPLGKSNIKNDMEIKRLAHMKGFRRYNQTGVEALDVAGGGGHQPCIVASRGRNPDNPNDRTTGSPTEQRLEVNSEGICNNLTSVQKDNMVMEGMKIRRLTPKECERLQGFPDNWTEGFSDTQRYKMMGNAVTVNVVKAVAERLA